MNKADVILAERKVKAQRKIALDRMIKNNEVPLDICHQALRQMFHRRTLTLAVHYSLAAHQDYRS